MGTSPFVLFGSAFVPQHHHYHHRSGPPSSAVASLWRSPSSSSRRGRAIIVAARARTRQPFNDRKANNANADADTAATGLRARIAHRHCRPSLTTALRAADEAVLSSGASSGDFEEEFDAPAPSSATSTTKGRNNSSIIKKLRKFILSIDVPLMIYFGLWYLGNYLYKITNKRCLKASGGAAGFPMTISSLQLGIGAIYGIFLWLAPDARQKPKTTRRDLVRMLPLAFCYAGTHSASVFSFSAGSVSFAEIVKAAEPAFAAVLSQFVYNQKVSKAKWLCIPIIIGGVVLASANELNFVPMALISACIANMFAAVRGNENKKLIESSGYKNRVGSVGNQFALTVILGFLLTIPFAYFMESHRWKDFCIMCKTTPTVRNNLLASALWFYGYNELSTMTLKKTGAVTQSVVNTAKRVIIILGAALVFGEALPPLKVWGCAIGIGGVFLYSLADQIFPPEPQPSVTRDGGTGGSSPPALMNPSD